MSFVFKKGITYLWPVSFDVPTDGGKFEKKSFDVLFKRIPQSKVKSLLSEDSPATDNDFCKEVMAGWKGIKDENEQVIEFSADSLAEILEEPGLARAIVIAFMESLAGAKAKN